jgi:hypothetical protein
MRGDWELAIDLACGGKRARHRFGWLDQKPVAASLCRRTPNREKWIRNQQH